MIVSPAGLAKVKHREGVVLTMYRDSAGLPTIGVGHLLTRDELRSGKIAGIGDWDGGLTPAQVDELLRRDLAIAEAAVSAVPVLLAPHQFDALVSLVFNIGVGSVGPPGTGFLGSTLRRLLVAGQFALIPAQFRRWIHSAGQVDPILKNRREEEIAQWEGRST